MPFIRPPLSILFAVQKQAADGDGCCEYAAAPQHQFGGEWREYGSGYSTREIPSDEHDEQQNLPPDEALTSETGTEHETKISDDAGDVGGAYD